MAEKRTTQARLGFTEMDFYTVGYERLSVEELFLMLKDAGVRCLVDVREAPWSRVQDYRKNILEDRLGELGTRYGHHVKYISMPSLGNPPENRNSDRSNVESMAFYRRHIMTKTKELDDLREIMSGYKAALMCYEADPAECHRSVLAAIMAERYGLAYADLRK